jgi:hypothetical protein
MNASGALIAGPSDKFLYRVIYKCLLFPKLDVCVLYSDEVQSFLNAWHFFYLNLEIR